MITPWEVAEKDLVCCVEYLPMQFLFLQTTKRYGNIGSKYGAIEFDYLYE